MERPSLRAMLPFLIWTFISTSFSHSAIAQPAVPNAVSTRIAVVDLSRVFKASKYFARERDILKNAIDDTQQSANAFVKEIEELTLEAEAAAPNSKERQALEERIKIKRDSFETDRKTAQRIAVRREAEIYHHVYNGALKAIEEHAKENRIDLVLRHTSDPPDLNNTKPADLINRVVLYQKGIDITDEIIRRVNAAEQQPEKVNP